MRKREPRRNVLVKARMRIGASWGDVSILNISSRGLMIHSAQAPPQGSYLEVRRGRHAIIARVVWSREQRFGVRTQDPISVESVLLEPDNSAPEARQSQSEARPVERRTVDARARSARERHEHSKAAGRALEFACIGIAGFSAAMAAYGMIYESLTRPLGEIGAALTSK